MVAMNDIRFDTTAQYNLFHTGYVQVIRDENYTFEYKKGKDRFSLIYVETGSLHYIFGDGEMRLQPGDMIFIPKNVPYKTVYLKKHTEIKILLFDLGKTLPPFPTEKPFCKTMTGIRQLFSSFTAQTSTDPLFLLAKTYELFYLLQNSSTETSAKYRKIIPAMQEMKDHYVESHPVGYYASLCHMSESNFRKLFKEYTGKSPIEYRNYIRWNAVRKMLDSGEFTVNEAAYFAGFNNMSFFYEVYRKYSG